MHKDKYDYSKTQYVNTSTKVCIICPQHGEFWQIPSNHLKGVGCPICNESKIENEIQNFLIENNIEFEREKNFDWLKYKRAMFLDFYLPNYNIAIECQGEQHFKPVKCWGGEKNYVINKLRDEVKFKLCQKNNISILYYSKFSQKNCITNLDDLLKQIKKEE